MSEWVELAQALAWPVVVLIALGILCLPGPRGMLKGVLDRVTRFKGGGFEVDLTAKESSQVKENLAESIRAFRKPVKQEFDRQAKVERIKKAVQRIHQEVLRDALTSQAHDCQATVYVADVVFQGLLYRLLDYYPRGGGSGKVYSIRFGIIGKAWRLEESLHATVPADTRVLIEEWGMTIAETATVGGSAKTFVCIVLKDAQGRRIGLLFVQSTAEDAFVEDVVARLEQSPAVAALSAAVDRVVRKLDEAAQPPIPIFDD